MKQIVKTALAVVWAVALITVSLPLMADDAKDRAKLISSAQSMLDKMSAEIKGFEKDSSAQDTVDAVRLSVALTKTLADLKKVQGDDDLAQDMVADWPGRIKAFQAAAVRLAKMKTFRMPWKMRRPMNAKLSNGAWTMSSKRICRRKSRRHDRNPQDRTPCWG